MKIAKPLIIPIIVASLGTTSAIAQDTLYTYSGHNGQIESALQYPNGFQNSDPGFPPELIGKSWHDLYASPNTFGANHSTLPRAFNWAWSTNVFYLNGTDDGWMFDLFGDYDQFFPAEVVFEGGAFDGQSNFRNPNIISFGSMTSLFTPGQDRLSVYYNDGYFRSDYSEFTVFTNGAFDGVSVADAISSLIAIDQDIMLLGEDGNLHIYDPSGRFIYTDDQRFFGGPADGMNYGELIASGMYRGLSYNISPNRAGLDLIEYVYVLEPIPEPSTALLIGAGAAMGLLRRTRRGKRTA